MTFAAHLEAKLGKPVVYLNDANAAALWGHFSLFGANSGKTSISIIVGTGNGGGVIIEDKAVEGKNGFGGELGHVLVPYTPRFLRSPVCTPAATAAASATSSRFARSHPSACT